MIRVVFDTSVLYSAILKPTGHPARAFDLITSGAVLPCVSQAVLEEYRDVFSRPALQSHRERAAHVLAILASVAVNVTPHLRLTVSEHEEDNRFYECAVASGADYIVTGNKKHFPTDYRSTKIVNARQLVELLAHGEKQM
jgi:putative PIN family toxin of toxin-antitoxin system